MEHEAQNLSHFGGDGIEVLNYEGEEMLGYTGEDDDDLDFDGNIQNFSVEGGMEKQFTFTVTNANAAARTALIWPGYYISNATLGPGKLVTGAFNDVNAAAGLTGASNVEKTIEELHLFLLYNPSRVIGMTIKSDVANQLQNDIILKPLDPFKDTESVYVRPKTFINQNTFQDKTVTFPCDIQLDEQMKMTYAFIGTSVTTITFFFGATLNKAKSLKKKARRAKRTMGKTGRKQVIRKSLGK